MLHDESLVYLYLRSPMEPTLTGLDEHSRSQLCFLLDISDSARLTQIIDTLCHKTDNQGRPILIADGDLFFVPSAAREARLSAGVNYRKCLVRTRERFSRYISKKSYAINMAYSAWLQYWHDEFYDLDEEAKAVADGSYNPGRSADSPPSNGLPQGDVNGVPSKVPRRTREPSTDTSKQGIDTLRQGEDTLSTENDGFLPNRPNFEENED